MEIYGKVIEISPVITGITKEGRNWSKLGFGIMNNDKYPVPNYFYLFGKDINKMKFEVGDRVLVSFDIISKKFDNRWFTDLKAFNVKRIDERVITRNLLKSEPKNNNYYDDSLPF